MCFFFKKDAYNKGYNWYIVKLTIDKANRSIATSVNAISVAKIGNTRCQQIFGLMLHRLDECCKIFYVSDCISNNAIYKVSILNDVHHSTKIMSYFFRSRCCSRYRGWKISEAHQSLVRHCDFALSCIW